MFAWLASRRRLRYRRRVLNSLLLGEAFASDFAWIYYVLIGAAILLRFA